jgi:nucleotide-binding universal stress UspA family protein
VARQAPCGRYEQVLIATDFSPASTAAARMVRRLLPDATFHVLHVCEVLAARYRLLAPISDAAIEDHRRRAGDQALRELGIFVRLSGLDSDTTSVEVRHGDVPARIKECTDQIDADVIVLGTIGKSWLKVGLLGSVSERVVAESNNDVLLVRKPLRDARVARGGFPKLGELRGAEGRGGTLPFPPAFVPSC